MSQSSLPSRASNKENESTSSSGSSSDVFRTPTQKSKKRELGSLLEKPVSQSLSNSEDEAALNSTPENKLLTNNRILANIPPSPSLKKIGLGTGVNVLLYKRPPTKPGSVPPSPWALKKFKQSACQVDAKSIAKRLEDEARVLKKLNHPNIIGYRGYKRQNDGTRILALEHGEKALSDVIEKMEEPFSVEFIQRAISSVASALQYLHEEKKILHGDVKSGNILVLGNFEKVKLCDFGVTVPLDDTLTVPKDSTVKYIGTGPWSAKEALGMSEHPVSHKTDIFALGCVIYEMLALQAPHMDDFEYNTDASEAQNESAYLANLGTSPALSTECFELLGEKYLPLIALMGVCTKEDPEKRFSAREVLQALERLEEVNPAEDSKLAEAAKSHDD